MQQKPALLELLQKLRRETSFSVLAFTGFSWDEIQRTPQCKELPANLDVLFTRCYVASQRLAQGLIGSANKAVHFLTQRYCQESMQLTPPAEVWIGRKGEVELSGIYPLQW